MAEMRKELTTGEVARLAGCTPQAVRWAIRSWRLPARVVAAKFRWRLLVWDEDAKAFARKRRLRNGKGPPATACASRGENKRRPEP